MTPISRHRSPFNMPLRYALCALFGLAMSLLCFVAVSYRSEFEPVIRFLHPFLLGRRSAEGYQPGDYVFYAFLIGILAVLPFAALAYGFATKARSDRKIDQHLSNRLPKHEITASSDDR